MPQGALSHPSPHYTPIFIGSGCFGAQGCAGTRIPPPSPVLRLHAGSWAGRWGQQAPEYQELDTASCRDAHGRQLPEGVTQARGKIRVFPARSRRGDAARPSAQQQLATRPPASTETSPKMLRDGVLKAKRPRRVRLPHQSLLPGPYGCALTLLRITGKRREGKARQEPGRGPKIRLGGSARP